MSNKNFNISRRNLLKGAGVSALGLGLLNLPNAGIKAQVASTNADVAAYYRFALGDAEMIVINDRTAQLPTAIFGANQEEGAAQEFLETRMNVSEDGTVPNNFLNLVMVTGDTVAIFDTGNGIGVGKLVPTLEALGIGADGVTNVLMSHWHGDHVNGLSNEGEIVFPNAQVHFPQVELDFLNNAPEDLAGGALGKLQPIMDADMLTTFGDGDELVPGVTAMATPGHTPGHTSWMIESAGSQMVHIVDAMVNMFTGMENPNWSVQFDADGAQATETRINLLTMIAEERIPFMGYHFSFPGVGYAVSQGENSWRFVPAAY